ncbi:hypothetical protein L6R29_11455 [Myxococcota bacterium]|nr:hypothetical protein [Myxococcota bacterium]
MRRNMGLVVIGLLVAFLVGTHHRAFGEPLIERRVDLVSWIESQDYGQAFGDQFQPIAKQDKAAFRRLIRAFMLRDFQKVQKQARRFEMRLSRLVDTATHKAFWLLQEAQTPSRGKGIYLTPAKAPRRMLVLQVPHPIVDHATHTQGAYLLRHLSPRLLMVASLQRCNHRQLTPCSGKTRVCKGGYRISDAAHFTESYFHTAHQAVASLRPRFVVLQLHGFTYRPHQPSAYLSDSTKRPLAGSLSNRLTVALNRELREAGLFLARSCNRTKKKGRVRLCATTNVQGRHSHGSSTPCSANAYSENSFFVHIEQRRRLRKGDRPGPAALLRALRTLFP